MILESYDKYEYQLFECGAYYPNYILKKLNELGNSGWHVIQSYGDIFENLNNGKILLERKITSTQV